MKKTINEIVNRDLPRLISHISAFLRCPDIDDSTKQIARMGLLESVHSGFSFFILGWEQKLMIV